MSASDDSGDVYFLRESGGAVGKLTPEGRMADVAISNLRKEGGGFADLALDQDGRLLLASPQTGEVLKAVSSEYIVDGERVVVPRPATNEQYVFDKRTGRHLETRCVVYSYLDFFRY